MRLPLISPRALTPEQKPLYDAIMRKGIASSLNAFQSEREDGAFKSIALLLTRPA